MPCTPFHQNIHDLGDSFKFIQFDTELMGVLENFSKKKFRLPFYLCFSKMIVRSTDLYV